MINGARRSVLNLAYSTLFSQHISLQMPLKLLCCIYCTITVRRSFCSRSHLSPHLPCASCSKTRCLQANWSSVSLWSWLLFSSYACPLHRVSTPALHRNCCLDHLLHDCPTDTPLAFALHHLHPISSFIYRVRSSLVVSRPAHRAVRRLLIVVAPVLLFESPLSYMTNTLDYYRNSLRDAPAAVKTPPDIEVPVHVHRV